MNDKTLVDKFSILISDSQSQIRTYAEAHLMHIAKVNEASEDIKARSRSIVSLRDIQRVFVLFRYFCSEDEHKLAKGSIERAVLLAVGCVYYFRLDTTSRKKYRDHIDTKCAAFRVNIDTVLNDAMSQVCKKPIQKGIAKTKGLKENIFLTWLCTAVRMPLMIIGPPGSSKTLAVNIVINNSKGKESQKLFYRNRPQLRATHYQCSKLSTDVEIKAAFDRAINTQKCVDKEKVQCIVFMDEADLEEQRESLKVLHYYTGGHMSTKADVALGSSNRPMQQK